jgi:hypothetical protein
MLCSKRGYNRFIRWRFLLKGARQWNGVRYMNSICSCSISVNTCQGNSMCSNILIMSRRNKLFIKYLFALVSIYKTANNNDNQYCNPNWNNNCDHWCTWCIIIIISWIWSTVTITWFIIYVETKKRYSVMIKHFHYFH